MAGPKEKPSSAPEAQGRQTREQLGGLRSQVEVTESRNAIDSFLDKIPFVDTLGEKPLENAKKRIKEIAQKYLGYKEGDPNSESMLTEITTGLLTWLGLEELVDKEGEKKVPKPDASKPSATTPPPTPEEPQTPENSEKDYSKLNLIEFATVPDNEKEAALNYLKAQFEDLNGGIESLTPPTNSAGAERPAVLKFKNGNEYKIKQTPEGFKAEIENQIPITFKTLDELKEKLKKQNQNS